MGRGLERCHLTQIGDRLVTATMTDPECLPNSVASAEIQHQCQFKRTDAR